MFSHRMVIIPLFFKACRPVVDVTPSGTRAERTAGGCCRLWRRSGGNSFSREKETAVCLAG